MSREGMNIVRLDAGEWAIVQRLARRAIDDPESSELTVSLCRRVLVSLEETVPAEGHTMTTLRTTETVLAEAVQVGDYLVLPDGQHVVSQIDAWDLANGKPVYPPYQQGGSGWPVLRILAGKGYARFPHERVQVIRAAVDKGSHDV